jgi:hypothetical protein
MSTSKTVFNMQAKILNIIIAIMLFSSCATIDVKGLYCSADCKDFSEDCFQYNFHDDGTYTYWYTNSTFGEFFLQGNYYMIGRTVKLLPIKYIYHDTTSIEYTPRICPDSTTIRISLLPGHLKNRPDTMHVPWLIKINDDKFYSETDEYGVYRVAGNSVKKIMVKEYSAKFYMDSEMPEADTTIEVSTIDKDIHILLASSVLEPIVIPPAKNFIYHKGTLVANFDTTSASSQYYKHTTKKYIKDISE